MTRQPEDPTVDPPPAAVPRWAFVAGVLIAAIATGAVFGVLFTGVLGLLGRPDPSASLVARASPRPTASATASPPEPSATATPEPSSSPIPTASAEPTESPPPAAYPGALPDGCFTDGFLAPSPEEPPGLIVAPDLRDRLPLPHWSSEPYAVVGSSDPDLFVAAFAACTGADPATIRFGGVNGGSTHGVIPFAIQVDGYTGWELADIFIDGYLFPEQRAELQTGEHDGWTYRWLDWSIAITASADTLYWMWVAPCCYEGGDGQRPSFEAVIDSYLELINDEPA